MGEPIGIKVSAPNDSILASWFDDAEHGAHDHEQPQESHSLAHTAGILADKRSSLRASAADHLSSGIYDSPAPVATISPVAQEVYSKPVAPVAQEAPAMPEIPQAPRLSFTADVPALPRFALQNAEGPEVPRIPEKVKPIDLSTTLCDVKIDTTAAQRVETKLTAQDRIDFIRMSPDSPSLQWLQRNGLAQEFKNNIQSEQSTWLPDGRFTMCSRTNNGYGWTIMINCDGTNSQRITDGGGKVLAQFMSNGRVIEPNANKADSRLSA